MTARAKDQAVAASESRATRLGADKVVGILISGGVGQSQGFLDALKAHLTQPIAPWLPVSGLSSQFTVAYGLALRTN